MVSRLLNYVNKTDVAINPPSLVNLERDINDLKSQVGEALEILERVQQQLAKMNEDDNLAPGDRHYE